MSVCFLVCCPSARKSQKPQSKFHLIFCRPIMSYMLSVVVTRSSDGMRYVMYFRFCGWRHVSYNRGNTFESKTTRMFRPVSQVAAPGRSLPSPTASCLFCWFNTLANPFHRIDYLAQYCLHGLGRGNYFLYWSSFWFLVPVRFFCYGSVRNYPPTASDGTHAVDWLED